MPRAAAIRRARSLGLAAAAVVAAGCAVATVAGFFGSVWWGLDLSAHFRPQYAIVAAVATGGLLAGRRVGLAGVGGAAVLANVIVIWPLWFGAREPVDDAARPLRLVSFNLNHHNARYRDVADYLVRADADVIALFEVTPEWHREVSAALPGYAAFAREDYSPFGIAVYSRVPVESVRVVALAGDAIPAVELAVAVGDRRYDVLAVHTMPPVNAATSDLRDRMLAAAGEWAHARRAPAIVVGDLNATPWSHAFRALLRDGSLVDSARGFGIQTSWPRDWWPMSIPIDHCLHGRELTTSNRFVGPFLGSDHRPLVCVVGPRAK